MSRNISKTIQAQLFDYAELSEQERKLIDLTKEALEDAYAPYSGFCVGSAVLLEGGTVVKGNNQENAAYPSGLCAERVAVFSAAANYPNQEILKVGIAAKPKGASDYVTASSCGNCRQALLEYQRKQQSKIELLFLRPNDEILKVGVEDLLPFGFGSDALGNS